MDLKAQRRAPSATIECAHRCQNTHCMKDWTHRVAVNAPIDPYFSPSSACVASGFVERPKAERLRKVTTSGAVEDYSVLMPGRSASAE